MRFDDIGLAAAVSGIRTLRVNHGAIIDRFLGDDGWEFCPSILRCAGIAQRRRDGVDDHLFSWGVRSRCAPPVGTTGAPLAPSSLCVTVVPVAQLESAKPAATAAITLSTEVFKSRLLKAYAVRMPLPNSTHDW